MRLDKWLKVSRLIKRRTVANEACDNERISANGRVVKASYDVKVGDKLDFGGLLGYAPVMPVNTHAGTVFAHRGGRMPAPINSLKN